MNDLSVWWHIGFVAAIALALFAVGSQPTHDIGFLFQVTPGTNADGNPWTTVIPFGIAGAFALSLLQAQWTYTGYDASAHVAEETVFARRASAWGVFLSVAVSAVVGYIVLVALTLKMTSPADVLANSGGGGGVQYILEQNLGAGLDHLGGLLAAGVAFAMTFCGFSSIASAGRMLFAFSRDDGVPGSSWLKKVSVRWRTPSHARHRDQRPELAADPARLRPHEGLRWRSVVPHRRHHLGEHRPALLGVRRLHLARHAGRSVMAAAPDLEPRPVEQAARLAVGHLDRAVQPGLPVPIRCSTPRPG